MSLEKLTPPSEAAINSEIWNAISSKPWTPPNALNIEALSALAHDDPRIGLSRAVDLMAFGGALVANHPVECAAKRYQACRELCIAARTNLVILYGSPDLGGDKNDQIRACDFDMPRSLGPVNDSLATDLTVIAGDYSDAAKSNYYAARKGNHQRWFNVRVETETFLSWIRSYLPSPQFEPESNCRNWLVAEMRKSLTARSRPKGEFFEEAHGRFPGLSKRGFDLLWRAAIRESGASAWAKAGAPRKK
jgi:hypothetical protein